MAITVKTIKKKPLAIKKNDPVADGEAAPAEGAPAVATPAPGRRKKAVKQPSYVFPGICAILTFLMFIAIVTLQYLEWKHYIDPPKTAFPIFGELGYPIPTGGAGASSANVEVADDEMMDDEESVDDEEPLDEAVPAE